MKKTINELERSFNEAEKLRNNGSLEKAVYLFLEILKKKPSFQPALNNVANCYFKLNKLDLAEQYYLKCLKINSNNILIINNLSLLYLKAKNFEKALPILQESLNKKIDQEHIVEKIAYCLTELNLFNELDEFCKKNIKIYPNNKIVLSYYRRNLFKIGKYEDGLKAYQKETGVIELDHDKLKIV